MLGKLQFGIDPWTQTKEVSVKMEEMALEIFQRGIWIWPRELTTAEPCPVSPIPNVFRQFVFAHRFVHDHRWGSLWRELCSRWHWPSGCLPTRARLIPGCGKQSWAVQRALGPSSQLYRMVWYLIYCLEIMGCFNLWNINFMTEVTKRRKRMWA